MKTRLHVTGLVALCLALASCMGIPLRSIPKLYSLQSQLLDGNPGEIMLAVQMDAKMSPPPGAIPVLEMKIVPDKTSTFPAIDKKIGLRNVARNTDQLRLPTTPASRRWHVYALPAEAQAELTQIQKMVKQHIAQKKPDDKSKTSVHLGIAFEELAVNAPQFANTRFETWLQAVANEGFFELWSGKVSEVFANAKKT